ncbi:MAG TPA: MFS transporter [Leptospiraceae bacterium]|nr:MFS transporter [Leptospiraceae bacterium]HMY66157.1 MFS transporter [Leptospiraceae bacterium]HNF14535.1 MFS transporter [Leptospiraceae bacterium]HNF23507.1 MFS transporter [Leptospiraceae bacterium]HNI25619.1 MFS transporter [Leptospiraceae bacterium]
MFNRIFIKSAEWPKDYFIILAGWTLSAVSFGSLLPFAAVYLGKRIGFDGRDIGLFFLYTAALRAAVQGYSGERSDISGRKKLMLSALFGRFFFLFLLALFNIFFDNNILFLLLLSFVYMFTSIFQPAAQAAVADCTNDEDFTDAFALVRIGGNLGWVLGPIAGGYIAEKSFSFLFAFSALFSFAGFIVFLLFYSNSSQKISEAKDRIHYSEVFSNTAFIFYCIVSFLMMITTSQLLSTLPHFFSSEKNIPLSSMGYYFGINGFTVILLQIPAAEFIHRISPYAGLALGSFLYASGYFMVGLADSFFSFAGVIALVSAAEVIVLPLTQSGIARLAERTTLGRYMGFFNVITVLAWSLGPLTAMEILRVSGNEHLKAWGQISIFAYGASVGFIVLHFYDQRRKHLI